MSSLKMVTYGRWLLYKSLDHTGSKFCLIVQYQKISILPPQKGLEFPVGGGGGGSLRPKNLKKCIKFNWNFQRGWGVLEKIPSMGEVWIFSGTTH